MYDLSRELAVILIINWWFGEVRERLSVSKQATQKFGAERFSLRKLSDLECGHAIDHC